MWGRLSVTLRVIAIYRPLTFLIMSTEPFWLQQKGFFAHPHSRHSKHSGLFAIDCVRFRAVCFDLKTNDTIITHFRQTLTRNTHFFVHVSSWSREQWDIKQQLKSSLREWGVTKLVCTDIFFSGGSDMLCPLTSYDLSIQVPAPYRPVIPAVTEVRIQYRIFPDNTNTISIIPGAMLSTLCTECVGPLMTLANQYR